MPNSNRMNWSYPSENQDPWFDQFVALVNSIDSSSYASREDRSLVMGGGGSVSFTASSGLLEWSDAFEVFSPVTGFVQTLAAGNATLEDGEILYVTVVRSPTNNITLTSTVSSQVPSSDDAYIIAIRRGDDVFFRFGAKIADGQTLDIFQAGGAGGSGTDTYERTATFTVPDGSSTTQEATIGRVTYAGSVIGLSTEITEAVTSGSIVINVKVGGITTLTTTLDISFPSSNRTVVPAATHPVVIGDAITVEVVPASYGNATTNPGGLTTNVTFLSGFATAPGDIPDASVAQKGITKVSVAPVLSNDPIAVGDNDTRVPSQDENDALQGTDGTPTGANRYVTDSDSRNTDARTPLAHDIGGAEHNSSTLAQFNTKISDANLDDSSSARPVTVQDDGSNVTNTPHTTLNFDAGITATDAGSGVVTISASGAVDASDTVKGVSKLSVAAAVPSDPISVGDNDTRVPSQDENDALQGTDGTPSGANRYVTDSDSRNTDNRPVNLQDEGSGVANTPHVTLNFTGAGVAVTDAGSGVATVNVPGGVGSDELVGITASDTTPGYLDTKFTPGTGLTRTVTSPGGNEGYTLDADLASNGAGAFGVSRLSTAPSSGSDPISVGDNDGRIPSQDENDALQGTDGAPSTSNRYVTNSDGRLTDNRPVNLQDEGINVTNTPHSTLNFTGTGVAVTDAGSGVATVNVSSSDELVGVTASDTTPGYLDTKISPGVGLSRTVTSPAGNEGYTLDADYAGAGAGVFGVTRLSTAPASASDPIAVGTNDSRVPTQDENDALQGTSGSPASGNRYVTDADSRLTDNRPVNVQDEGSNVTNTPHATINFTGAGVTASDAGSGVVTVNVPGGSGDELVGVTAADTTPGYLDSKINPGVGLSRTVTTPAGNEGYTLDADLASNTASAFGVSRLSTAPASASDPIVVGDNDARVPSQDENDALLGTDGTPSTSNRYVTNSDSRLTDNRPVNLQEEGTNVTNTPHSTINFIGSSVTVTDAGSGVASVTITDSDQAVKVTSSDTTPSDLDTKITPGIGLSRTVTNPAGDEGYTLDADYAGNGAGVFGVTRLSAAPASASDPIAAGTNDTRIPSQDENDALLGTDGTPSTSNRYVTNSDSRLTDNRSVTLQDEGSGVTNTPHSTLNFTGAGITVTDAGSGVATINVPGGPASDELVGVTASDTTPGYLDTKITPGVGLSRTVTSPAGDEGYTLDADLASNTASAFGVSRLSTAPASASDPIVVGDNDTRVPTQDENDALQGTDGSPSTSNRYVTNSDSRLTDSRPVNVQDEGSNVTNTPHSTINFTGTGVTASDAGSGVVTVNIPGGAASDELVGVTAADTTPGYLDAKIVPGIGLSRTITNPAGDEDFTLDADYAGNGAGVFGVTRLSAAPASASDPIAVGDNDGRVPSQDENDALLGTDGTPSTSNRYVTNSDSRLTDNRTADAIATSGSDVVIGTTAPTTDQILAADSATTASWHSASDLNLAETDVANTYTKGQHVQQVTLTDSGGAIAVDASTSNNFELELDTGGGSLSAPTNVVAGTTINIAIRQDSTGSNSLTLNSAYKVTTGTIPTTADKEVLLSGYVRAESSGTATVVITSITPEVDV